MQQSRHGTTYFFRRRVPGDLQGLVGHRQLYKSLCTNCRRTAIILARVLAVKTDRYFSALRMSNDNDNDNDDTIRLDWVLSFDMGDLGLLKVESQPHDTDGDKAQALAAFEGAAKHAIELQAAKASVVADAHQSPRKTLRAAIAEFLAGSGLKPRSVTAYTRALEIHAIPYFGADADFFEIDQKRFSQFVEHLQANVTTELSTLKGFVSPFTSMRKWHWQ